MAEVRDKLGLDHVIGARPHRAAASQMVQCAPGKVIAVPCPEKGRSPDAQMLISGCKDPVFSFRLAASVNRVGISAFSFALRAFAYINHQLDREGNERHASYGALLRQARCTCRVCGT